MADLTRQYSGGQKGNKMTGQVSRGIWMIRLTYVALAFSGGLDLFSAISKGAATEIYLSAVTRLVGALIIFLFAELPARKGRATQAALVTILTAIIALFLMCLLEPVDIGWLLGIVIGLLLSVVAIQLMPSIWMGPGIFIAFTGGSLVAMTDFFRQTIIYTPDFSSPQTILLGVLSLVLFIILFLRFSTYPVTAKLVLAIASLTTIILNVLGIVISGLIHSKTGISPDILLSTNLYLLMASQISIVLSSLTALVLARLITFPLTEIVTVADRVARDGDLSQHTRIYYHDEVGRMAEAFNHMIDTLDEMAHDADRLAQGDLTVDFIPRSEKDVLGLSFGLMTRNLRGLVSQISENSGQVVEASSNLANVAQIAGAASTQISQAMDQIAHGAIQQANVATHTADSAEQMRATIADLEQGTQYQSDAVKQADELTHQIVKAIQQVSTDAKAGVVRAGETVEEANKGAQTIQQTIVGIGTIQSKVEASALKVQEMKNRSEQISNILAVIEEISNQINLLALNAAIEAARAGEQGKGFAVVADEVRKLAKKSSSATKEISNLVQGIKTTTQETVIAMNSGLDEVKSGMDRAGSAGQALEKIIDTIKNMQQQVSLIADSTFLVDSSASGLISAMSQVNSMVEQNTAATQKMSYRSTEVSRSAENIASISEENSAAVEEVSANVDEMSTQVTRVNKSAQMLNEMAMSLRNQVKRFTL
ncbi:MAG: hypothetical protein CVU39_14575 [Chloroflexi bacterium HGW-Chloroflexi-10]|nr:MAG: hypothetical protein CVU39_14575 [Chloroflexi bacterium HGW-Chloroflexi-10]